MFNLEVIMKTFLSILLIFIFSMRISFAQQSCGTIKDYDENTYKTVQIGSQCWMAENLRTKHYSDGTLIDFYDYKPKNSIHFWQYPGDDSKNEITYGLMYSWAAAVRLNVANDKLQTDEHSICPIGWHVPSKEEWNQMFDYLGGQKCFRCGGKEDNIAKSLASQTGWDVGGYYCPKCTVGHNPEQNNLTGFNAKPTGGFLFSEYKVGQAAYFWTSTAARYENSRAYIKSISPGSEVVIEESAPMNCVFSVRCLRD